MSRLFVNINVVLHIIVTLSNLPNTARVFSVYRYVVTLVVEVEIKSAICCSQVLVVVCVGTERKPHVGYDISCISIIFVFFVRT